MRKLYLDGKEYVLRSGDALVLEYDKVVLLRFLAIDSKGRTHKLTFVPDGDEKLIAGMGFGNFVKINPRILAHFICDIIGFEANEIKRNVSSSYFFSLHKRHY